MTDFGVEVNRFMERFYIESRAVDLESLCIVAGEKVYCTVYIVHCAVYWCILLQFLLAIDDLIKVIMKLWQYIFQNAAK